MVRLFNLVLHVLKKIAVDNFALKHSKNHYRTGRQFSLVSEAPSPSSSNFINNNVSKSNIFSAASEVEQKCNHPPRATSIIHRSDVGSLGGGLTWIYMAWGGTTNTACFVLNVHVLSFI